MLLAVALGLIFSATDFGSGVDGLLFDRIAPLLGTPREVHDPPGNSDRRGRLYSSGNSSGIVGNPPCASAGKDRTRKAGGNRVGYDPSPIPIEPNH